jgi:hypothetical protein
MHAERAFLETDEFGNLKAVPKLPPHSRVEAIFLVLAEEENKLPRAPHPDLAGITHIKGDLIAPAIDLSDWDMMRLSCSTPTYGFGG